MPLPVTSTLPQPLRRTLLTLTLLLTPFLASADSPTPQATLTPVSTQPLKVAYGADNIADYYSFVGNRAVESIEQYSGQHARRDVIDAVLFMQALRLGGIKDEIEFVGNNTYQRILNELIRGNVVAGAQTNWGEDVLFQPSLYSTKPLVREGEFVVGIYTRPDNSAALNITSLPQLQKLSAVSNRQWRSDWRTLIDLNIEVIYHHTLWVNMVKMVSSGRVDFTLAPFQTSENLALHLEEINLIPIPNMKIALHGSRHWNTSRANKDGARVYAALESGLAQLRKQGRIVRAYQESGFFNERVANWVLLNPPEDKLSKTIATQP